MTDTKHTSRQLNINKRNQAFSTLSRRILRCANLGLPRIEFLAEVCKMLSKFSGCDAVTVRTKERGKYFGCQALRSSANSIRLEVLPPYESDGAFSYSDTNIGSKMNKASRLPGGDFIDLELASTTKNGSFWIERIRDATVISAGTGIDNSTSHTCNQVSYKSLAIIPFAIDNDNDGFMQLMSKTPNYFGRQETEFYEGVAQTIGIAVADRRAQEALRERVKELTCLYNIARAVDSPDFSMQETLQSIVELLPPACLYPEVTHARIVLDNDAFLTPGFRDGLHKLATEIMVVDMQRGVVEVLYTKEKPELDEGPFLKEERHLINAVAKQVGQLVERKQADEDKARLQEQIRHADRLATIGQLAAGMAHELNEPLGSILGFAQLIQKTAGMPEQAEHDLEKIVSASLYARDVIRKLLIFSRKTPAKLVKADLNQLVQSGLYFLEARCAKAGIELVKELSASSPMILADAAQIHQILINLAVNAIQALPNGGKLTIQTRVEGDSVALTVKDNGVGMSEEVKKQIFVPFFTTKDVNEGTGLGLPVVHGIVTAHGGEIRVDSAPGRGTKFEINLPVWQQKTS